MALSESELVSKIETLLQKRFQTELTFREVSAGYGIADLVIAPNDFGHTTGVAREPITHFSTLKFFLDLTEESYSLDELLATSPFTPKNETKRYISFLLRNQYLIADGEVYKKSSIMLDQQPIKKIIAIEAKLTDYKNGIIQAKRYQYFADQSYLAILRSAAKNFSVEQLTQSGIGLMLFDEKTEEIEIVSPTATLEMQENIYKVFATELMLSRMNAIAA